MTPEERQMLTALASRVKNASLGAKDGEAEALLRQLAQEQPDTSYILAQTVLMQDLALRSAEARVNDLQRQLDAARSSSAGNTGGSFLGSAAGSGPWSRPTQPQYQQPQYQQAPYQAQPAYQPSPWGGPAVQPSQTGGFLREAATTAVGVAGGAMLFQGLESLFGGHQGGGGFFGGGSPWGAGIAPQESVTETTIINNYNDDGGRAEDRGDVRRDDYQPDNADPGFRDASYDTSSDQGGYDNGGLDDSSNYDSGNDDGLI